MWEDLIGEHGVPRRAGGPANFCTIVASATSKGHSIGPTYQAAIQRLLLQVPGKAKQHMKAWELTLHEEESICS